MDTNNGSDTVGRAANRYVSLQIATTVIGLILAVGLIFGFFLPLFHQVSGSQTAMDTQMTQQQSAMNAQMQTMPGAPGTTTTSGWHTTK